MSRILVPYHLDEYLPDWDAPLAADTQVAAELSNRDTWSRLAELHGRTRDAVAESLHRAEHTVVVSGDCMASLGTLAGMQQAGFNPGIVWLDAHGDLQTLETSESGYLGGLPLRLMVGYRPELIAVELGLRPVQEHSVLLVDGRDLDPPEAEYLRTADMRRAVLHELSEGGLPDGQLYLHVDLDIVDPDELPGLRVPAVSGPALSEVAAAIGRVLETGRVVAVGLACSWHAGHGAGDRVRPYVKSALAAWRPGVAE